MIDANDSFISDEEEECCPLCVEEMDVSDKNFIPCPCGYQVCQFCYHNIRNNPELNGRCPACRRLYDDESVSYKVVNSDEWKNEQTKQAKKDRERKLKEKERRENDQANRRHLAGMRVIQKNLVYVVGLNLNSSNEDLHSILRSDKYFGQYGKILKIVINKKNQPLNLQALPHFHSTHAGFGVYVTFSRKEEASRCIAAIDGTYSDGKLLKAAHGTTKYCSSYLRGQPCPNPNCMFLHEPGEEADSYSRQDLSTRQGLKMEGEEFKNNAFQRNYYEDDGHISARASPVISHALPTSSGSSTPSSLHPQPLANVPLPPTSTWASGSKAPTPAMEQPVLANASAFPTLSEVLTQQQLQQKEQHKQHQQQKKQKHQNNNNNANSDIFNPDAAAFAFIDESIAALKNSSGFHFEIKPTFYNGDLSQEEINSYPSMITFGSVEINTDKSAKSVELSKFKSKLIDSLVLKPKLVHHFQQLQQEHRLKVQQSQQLAIQQQQQQLQAQLAAAAAQTQATPQQLPQQLHDPLQQQLQLQQLQASTTNAAVPQQYQQQQQVSQNIHSEQLQQSIATPPPGLFTAKPAENFQSQQMQHQGSVSGASELLNHLMKGKAQMTA